MNDKDLKKLKREDLLQILVAQGKRIEELERELQDTKNKLEERFIDIKESGTMAEAAMKLNDVFEAADRAAKQYLDSLKAKQKKEEKAIKKALYCKKNNKAKEI